MDFSKIDISIKTFLRDEKLFHAIGGIQDNLSGARMIIADDGDPSREKTDVYRYLNRSGHITEEMPFDSGFGAKSNRILELSTRPYLLVGSDDFDFTDEAAAGIDELVKVLDRDRFVDIASGRVNNRPYEFNLKLTPGQYDDQTQIEEVPLLCADTESVTHVQIFGVNNTPLTSIYCPVDLTVNYSLIRRQSLLHRQIKWDQDVKIGGGEHGAFFYDCKVNQLNVVWVSGVNINEQTGKDSPRYKLFRNRAAWQGRPCFDRRGITRYVLGDGRIDYEANYTGLTERQTNGYNLSSQCLSRRLLRRLHCEAPIPGS